MKIKTHARIFKKILRSLKTIIVQVMKKWKKSGVSRMHMKKIKSCGSALPTTGS